MYLERLIGTRSDTIISDVRVDSQALAILQRPTKIIVTVALWLVGDPWVSANGPLVHTTPRTGLITGCTCMLEFNIGETRKTRLAKGETYASLIPIQWCDVEVGDVKPSADHVGVDQSDRPGLKAAWQVAIMRKSWLVVKMDTIRRGCIDLESKIYRLYATIKQAHHQRARANSDAERASVNTATLPIPSQ